MGDTQGHWSLVAKGSNAHRIKTLLTFLFDHTRNERFGAVLRSNMRKNSREIRIFTIIHAQIHVPFAWALSSAHRSSVHQIHERSTTIALLHVTDVGFRWQIWSDGSVPIINVNSWSTLRPCVHRPSYYWHVFIVSIMVVIICDIGNHLFNDIDWVITFTLDGGDSIFGFTGEKNHFIFTTWAVCRWA